jgi:hypothetical protein
MDSDLSYTILTSFASAQNGKSGQNEIHKLIGTNPKHYIKLDQEKCNKVYPRIQQDIKDEKNRKIKFAKLRFFNRIKREDATIFEYNIEFNTDLTADLQ